MRARKGLAGSPPEATMGHRPSRHGLLHELRVAVLAALRRLLQLGVSLDAPRVPHGVYRATVQGVPLVTGRQVAEHGATDGRPRREVDLAWLEAGAKGRGAKVLAVTGVAGRCVARRRVGAVLHGLHAERLAHPEHLQQAAPRLVALQDELLAAQRSGVEGQHQPPPALAPALLDAARRDRRPARRALPAVHLPEGGAREPRAVDLLVARVDPHHVPWRLVGRVGWASLAPRVGHVIALGQEGVGHLRVGQRAVVGRLGVAEPAKVARAHPAAVGRDRGDAEGRVDRCGAGHLAPPRAPLAHELGQHAAVAVAARTAPRDVRCSQVVLTLVPEPALERHARKGREAPLEVLTGDARRVPAARRRRQPLLDRRASCRRTHEAKLRRRPACRLELADQRLCEEPAHAAQAEERPAEGTGGVR
eukprot:scaffold130741_cov63-Phaeocystis_antarctica.AAC.2